MDSRTAANSFCLSAPKMSSSSSHSIILLVSLFLFSCIAQATVPISKTFKLVNSGISYGYVEGDDAAQYTDVEQVANQRFEKLSTHPFNLCFYSHDKTQAAFTLGIRLDQRLVWIAKQAKPVGINATLTFGRQGNLVLADAKGQMVWQTGTANKGVVDIKLLPNGNMVLLDNQGRFIWQSFDYPIDLLLVGQSLRANGVNKLVSRRSPIDPTPGDYSMVMGAKTITFYYKGQPYSQMESLILEGSASGQLANVTIVCSPPTYKPFLTELTIEFSTVEAQSQFGVIPVISKYNTTYSFLKLGQDGNLRFHTYDANVKDTTESSAWEETFILFSRRQFGESECKLPERCGALGVCEDNQCVACPTPKGLMGWSKSCAAPKLPANCSGGKKATYYKVVGMDHFSSNYAGVTMKQGDCKKKCSLDCKCKGFFYRQAESKCLLTPLLNTLTKVSNSTHLAFIKISSEVGSDN